MSKKIINKNFLINALNEDDQKLKDHQPPPNYKVLGNLDVSLDLKTRVLINGVLTTPNLLDSTLQTKFPFTLFGLTDYFGGYFNSVKYVAPSINPWLYATSGVNGFNNIYTFAEFGDMVRQFTSRIGVTDYFVDMFLSTSNQIGYGTILNNLSDSKYLIDSLRIQIPNTNLNQFDNPLIISKLRIDGKMNIDTINIRTYVTPQDFQTSIAMIPLNIILDKNLMINQYINYDCQDVQYQFKLKKIK